MLSEELMSNCKVLIKERERLRERERETEANGNLVLVSLKQDEAIKSCTMIRYGEERREKTRAQSRRQRVESQLRQKNRMER